MKRRDAAEPDDGRMRRSARTRALLVEATKAVVAGGEHPTPERIAAQAGVSERTLFRHFGALPALWEAVRIETATNLTSLLDPGPFEGDVQRRARELVRRRIAAFEAIAPYRRFVDAREAIYPAIREGRAALDRMLRAQTAKALAAELSSGADTLAPAIDALLSYESWNYLRASRGLGPRQVATLLESALLRLVAAPTSRAAGSRSSRRRGRPSR
jgi:AcrR family transcriptional regulator